MSEYKRLTDEKKYERLTKRDNEFGIISLCKACKRYRTGLCTAEESENVCCIDEQQERLAELEDKIENGTLIELPCGVGDRVYVLDNDKISDKPKISEASVIDFDITSYNFSVLVRENGYDYHLFNCGLGCDWFLSKAEAEEKLKELQNER